MNYGRLKTCKRFFYSQLAFVFPHQSLQNWQQERSGRSRLASPKCHNILSKTENIIIFSQVAISKNSPHQFCLTFNICNVAESKALQQPSYLNKVKTNINTVFVSAEMFKNLKFEENKIIFPNTSKYFCKMLYCKSMCLVRVFLLHLDVPYRCNG